MLSVFLSELGVKMVINVILKIGRETCLSPAYFKQIILGESQGVYLG